MTPIFHGDSPLTDSEFVTAAVSSAVEAVLAVTSMSVTAGVSVPLSAAVVPVLASTGVSVTVSAAVTVLELDSPLVNVGNGVSCDIGLVVDDVIGVGIGVGRAVVDDGTGVGIGVGRAVVGDGDITGVTVARGGYGVGFGVGQALVARCGMVAGGVNMLPMMKNSFKHVNGARSGKGPVNLLRSMKNTARFVSLASCVGTVPSNLLSLARTDPSLVSNPKQVGQVPLNKLRSMASAVKLVSWQICCGSEPLILLR
jgi:hypothetical protein